MLAIVVTSAADNGAGTLRAAIAAANTTMGIDEIVFDLNAMGSNVITLTSGELKITDELLITGPGSGVLAVSGDNSSRIFHVELSGTSGNVTIAGLTIRDGSAPADDGGALLVTANGSEEILFNDINVFGSSAGQGGGAYFTAFDGARVSLINSTIGHTAPENGNTALLVSGGGLFVRLEGNSLEIPAVTIANSQIINNSAPNAPAGHAAASVGGGGIYVRNGIVLSSVPGQFIIRDSVISGNTTSASGGGLYAFMTGDYVEVPQQKPGFLIERTAISGNTAHGFGGGAYFRTPIDEDFPNDFESVRIVDTTISSNTSYGEGAGDGTSPPGGGGLMLNNIKSTARIANSTISGNRAVHGGGVLIYARGTPFYENSRVLIQHSTIANNAAGPFDPDDPSRPEYGDMNVPTSATIAQLTAGGGIELDPGNLSPASLILDHTIVADNEHYLLEPEGNPVDNYTPDIGMQPNGVAPPNYEIEAIYSIIENRGDHYNVTYTIDFTGLSEMASGVDPVLGLLADNGAWFTLPDGNKIQTHALMETSPAIDTGSSGATPGMGTVPLFDERGTPYTRVYDGNGDSVPRIDIGAYEYQPIQPEPCPAGDYNNDGIVDAADFVVWRNANGQSITLPNDLTPGTVDESDYLVWRANFGRTCPMESHIHHHHNASIPVAHATADDGFSNAPTTPAPTNRSSGAPVNFDGALLRFNGDGTPWDDAVAKVTKTFFSRIYRGDYETLAKERVELSALRLRQMPERFTGRSESPVLNRAGADSDLFEQSKSLERAHNSELADIFAEEYLADL